LVHKKKRQRALENIYYAVHKYCDYNQIFIVADGDDHIIGKYAFKTFNYQYQRYKIYSLYSQYLAYGAPYHH
jgi:hypothetical protein